MIRRIIILLAALTLGCGLACAEETLPAVLTQRVFVSVDGLARSGYQRALVTEAIRTDWTMGGGTNSGLTNEQSFIGWSGSSVYAAIRDAGGSYWLLSYEQGSDVLICLLRGVQRQDAETWLDGHGCAWKRNSQTDLYQAGSELASMVGSY